MKLRAQLLLAVLSLIMTAYAQEQFVPSLRMEARGDYVFDSQDKDASRLRGSYLNLVVDGKLGEKVSYALRHRLNKTSFSSTFFDATDWLLIDYSPTPWLSVSAGKQVVGIGGFEYDAAPIDLYFCSEFWQHIACYQWGASVRFSLPGGNDAFVAQWCQSPFHAYGKQQNIYAYNLLWTGRHGIYSSLWSVNMLEYAPGRFINYIVLGNELRLRQFSILLDLYNRTADPNHILLHDLTAVGQVSYRPVEWLHVFAKMTYDSNRTRSEADYMVMPHTELTQAGGGIELYPLKNRDLRIHASYSYSWGRNTNPDGVLHDRQSAVCTGVSWKMHILPHF